MRMKTKELEALRELLLSHRDKFSESEFQLLERRINEAKGNNIDYVSVVRLLKSLFIIFTDFS